MKLVGVLLLIMGAAIAYAAGTKGLTVSQMIDDVKKLL